MKKIFFDENYNWDNFVKLHLKSIRKVVLEEVEKFRLCGEKEAGFSLFACDVCGEIKIVPHRCKGRFCSVCATGYMQEWSKKTVENMYNMPQKEKTETITVMEFIARIIRHIPDVNFKTIRYYGLYSRRNKGKVDKILKIKKNKIPKKSWKEKIEEGTGKNPLMCPRCEIEMEYKGQVCLRKGKLVIIYAKCIKARRCLEELIGYEPSGKEKDTKRGRKEKEIRIKQPKQQQIDGQIHLLAM